jgi:ATP-dependent DNA helicase RecQ
VRAVYRGERRISLRKDQVEKSERRASARQSRDGRARGHGDLSPHDLPLFEALRAWRRDEAHRQGLPPYVIFHDRTLAEIARDRPGTLPALARIGGVGQGKLERYGRAVLAVVAQAMAA